MAETLHILKPQPNLHCQIQHGVCPVAQKPGQRGRQVLGELLELLLQLEKLEIVCYDQKLQSSYGPCSFSN